MAKNWVRIEDRGKKGFYDFVNRMETVGKDEPHVDIGVLTTSPQRRSGLSNVDVAVWNELGVPSKNIPSRPFMRETYAKESKRVDKYLNKVYEKAGSSSSDTKKVLTSLGRWYKRSLRLMIKQYSHPRNAESTIAKKGEDDPLVDTEQLMNSIRYRVRTKTMKGGK
jgi:hypothetical protein